MIKLGEGDKLLFWHHVWIGDQSLEVLFPRLFRLNTNQEGTIKSMGNWVQGKWVWLVGWSRDLLSREIEVADRFLDILNGASLLAGVRDEWRWKASPNGVYSTKSAYLVLRAAVSPTTDEDGDRITSYIWKGPAPYKAIMTSWRVLKGRMATCENLARRNVNISADDAKCVACKVRPETLEHLFFSCNESGAIWQNMIKWLGVQSALHGDTNAHFLLFINLGAKANRKLLMGIWIAVVWCIWYWKNECKFNNNTWDRHKIVAEIKSRLWSWKLAYGIFSHVSDFRSWFSSDSLLSYSA